MKIGLIGFGKMGASIFKLLNDNSFEITVIELNQQLMENSSNKFFQKLERSLTRQGFSTSQINLRKAAYHFSSDLSALANTDIVIEAVYEDFDLKVKLFQQVESIVRNDTIMLTNTSSISIDKLSRLLFRPERFCGFHFFHPIVLIKIVEIIKTGEKPEWLIEKLITFSRQIGKEPVVVMDGPGSVINAILVYYYAEAIYILEEGIALPSQIDRYAKTFFYVGPCESVDIIGIDLFLAALANAPGPNEISLVPIRRPKNGQENLPQETIGGRKGFYYPPLFEKLLADHRLGKKVSLGLYRYEKSVPIDDVADYYLNPKQCTQNTSAENHEEIISNRLLYAVFNGVVDCLKNKMSSERDIDLGIQDILQMKEGPITMIRNMGIHAVYEVSEKLAERYGERFRQMNFFLLNLFE
jgi:3-hydroxyacyl-CoA dehydrogenase